MELEILQQIWKHFVDTGELDPRIQPVVAESWRKCHRYGLDPWAGKGKKADEAVFHSILEENKDLLDTALPIMHSVYEIVERSHFLLVLTDSVGYVMEAIGDTAVHKMSKDLRFLKGALWNDLEVGSNAIGIALDYDTAIQMVGPEHYCTSHHNWTCSAAPIHGIDGEVIGCLDLSGDVHEAHLHTLALVVAAAFSIETMLIRLHSTRLMRGALDGMGGSIILLNDRFNPVWANKAAMRFLGLPLSGLETMDFREIMPDLDWNQIQQWDRGDRYFTNDTRLLIGDNTYYCSASIAPTLDASNRTFTVSLKKQEHLIDSVNKVSGNRANYTFDSIYAKDPLMRKTILLAQKYARYDGIVLIEGESGTGKELFAQAIHNGSSRADGPFVAVNCASLPRDLVESELFGYEKGAFTGALKEGNPGKFELANHGTLFLDEIGEMPLEFQAKLLRAVETLQIRRLGGNQEKKLDVRVIAATNRNLRLEAEQGRFRQDLYYRLNVLKLNIPPLRERSQDIVYCAKEFLARFNRRYPDQHKEMSEGFLRAMEKYDWPGNVRELQNSIERTFYASGGNTFTKEDFCYVMSTGIPRDQDESAGDQDERDKMLCSLQTAHGRVEEAALAMGVSRATFYRMCKRWGIEPKSMRK